MKITDASIIDVSHLPPEDQQKEAIRISQERIANHLVKSLKERLSAMFTPEELDTLKEQGKLRSYTFADVRFYYADGRPVVGFLSPRLQFNENCLTASSGYIEPCDMPTEQAVLDQIKENEAADEQRKAKLAEAKPYLDQIKEAIKNPNPTRGDLREVARLMEQVRDITGEGDEYITLAKAMIELLP